MVAAGKDNAVFKQNLLWKFIVGWVMMALHFVAHFLFMPGLKVWTETVECACPTKKPE